MPDRDQQSSLQPTRPCAMCHRQADAPIWIVREVYEVTAEFQGHIAESRTRPTDAAVCCSWGCVEAFANSVHRTVA